MSRSRRRTHLRLAWACALSAALAAPSHSADLVESTPRLLVQYEEGLRPLHDTPLLLAIPQDCAAVALDFVPPVPQVPGQRTPTASAPATSSAPRAVTQRLPLESQPRGLADGATGYVAKPLPVTPSPAPSRLPAAMPEARPTRVAARPSEPGSMLIDRLEPASKVQPTPTQPVVRAITPPAVERAIVQAPPARPAMMAVTERAFSITRNAAALADRGAYYSARSEFIQALRIVTQALDAQAGDSQHSLALAEGLRALSEADDFAPRGAQLEADLDLASIVASHRTAVLKQQDVAGLTPLYALQQYYTFAQQRLSTAGNHEPAAAEALFGLGRLTMLMAEQSADDRRLHAPKAMTLFQAALAVNARHARAAHELGVLYAQFGQLEDARRLLVISVNLSPQKETWHNLAVVHERLGEADLARKARFELQLAMKANTKSVASNGIAVDWVDASQFAGQAPPTGAPAARAASRSSAAGQSNPWFK